MKKAKLITLTLLLTFILLVGEIVLIRTVSKYEPQVSVVYAKVKIPEDTVIKADMLTERSIGISMAHRQSVRKISEAIGKRARVDLEEGEMILGTKLAAETEGEEIRVKDSSNRLFTVEFKGDQANGWLLKPDQYVDIIFVPNERANSRLMQDGDGTGIPFKVQRLENVRIAAIIDDKGKLLKRNDSSSMPRYISFEVTDKQDEFLAYAKSNGRLEISVIP